MICTLIEAAERNEAFTKALTQENIRNRLQALKAGAAVAAYHLGKLTKEDMRNFEIYADMANTITKIFDKLDDMVPPKKLVII
jgi:hypothetical protein